MTVELETKDTLIIQEFAHKHPDKWIEEVFNCKLWAMQKDIARDVFKRRRVAVKTCSGTGKTYIAARIALCFLYTFYPSTVLTTSSSFRQVQHALWREINSAKGKATIPLAGKYTLTSIDLDDKWFAIGISTKEPERFTGLHNKHMLVIADEASGLDEVIFAAMENPLSTGNTHQLLISNPTQPTGSFRDAFSSPLYNTFSIDAFHTPNLAAFGITMDDMRSNTWASKITDELPYPELINPEAVYEQYLKWGEGNWAFQVWVLANFPPTGTDTLFSLEEIESAMERQIEPNGELFGALDVARYGDDESVFGLRCGDHVYPFRSWAHAETTHTAGRTIREIRTNKPYITTVDSVGVGGGVFDMLEEEGLNVAEFNAGNEAVDKEHFVNRRAELFWLLKDRFKDEAIDLPDDDLLKAQLLDVRYTYDRKGRMQIESKEQARSRGSRSPDRADALMMLFAPVSLRKLTKPRQKCSI